MKTIFPTYENSIVQVANSLRVFTGLAPYHTTQNDVDAWMKEHDFDHVIALLIDGMGTYQIKQYLPEDAFLNTYLTASIQTVYPSTTVAATTSMRCGMTPAESGYLGWHQYFETIDDSVVIFRNTSYYGHASYPDFVLDALPYQTIVEEANEKGKQAIEIFPAWSGSGCDSVDKLCAAALDAAKDNRYVYAYWDMYDSCMHDEGVDSPVSIEMLKHIDETIAQLAAQLDAHTGLLVIADHGHINIQEKSLLKYPDIMDCFLRKPTLEVRTINFHIKETAMQKFPALFDKYFGRDFHLYTKAEAIAINLFGPSHDTTYLDAFLGDYIACSTSPLILTCGDDFAGSVKGYHAGMSEEEMMIPLVLYPK